MKIVIPIYNKDTITINLENKLGRNIGTIDSTLRIDKDYEEVEGNAERYVIAFDGLLELILSLACQGINVKSEEFIKGIEDAHTEINERYFVEEAIDG